MIGRSDRKEYYCGTWSRAQARGQLAECSCERNGVRQEVIEEYVERYLEETSQRLEMLTGPGVGGLTEKLETQEVDSWRLFTDGIARLTGYLAERHPEEYAAIIAEQQSDPFYQGEDFIDACVKAYRQSYDPAAVDTRLSALRAEHERLVKGWVDLPTQRAKDTAAARLAELEGEMQELETWRADAAEVVAGHYQEVQDLQRAIGEAERAMRSERGALALRQRAESLRGLLCRIECEFVVTGKRSCGPGNSRSKLAAVRFLPVAGDTRSYAANVSHRSQAKP
jgi:hypothetical protein